MTEQEAKTKWCPAYRYSIAPGPDGGFNPHDNRPPTDLTSQALCMGSACMAWRWVFVSDEANQDNLMLVESKTDGHCGLAGKP